MHQDLSLLLDVPQEIFLNIVKELDYSSIDTLCWFPVLRDRISNSLTVITDTQTLHHDSNIPTHCFIPLPRKSFSIPSSDANISGTGFQSSTSSPLDPVKSEEYEKWISQHTVSSLREIVLGVLTNIRDYDSMISLDHVLSKTVQSVILIKIWKILVLNKN